MNTIENILIWFISGTKLSTASIILCKNYFFELLIRQPKANIPWYQSCERGVETLIERHKPFVFGRLDCTWQCAFVAAFGAIHEPIIQTLLRFTFMVSMDGYAFNYLLCLPPQKTGVEICIIPRFNNINWRGDESSSETCCRSCREMARYTIF